jgi:L-iditol 2-dehydrogenase
MLGVERDGAFAEFVAVPAAQLYRMPDEVSLRRGAYLEPMAASMAVLDAGLEPSMRGVVWGGGRIAELTARVMRAAGFSELTIHTPGRAPAPEPASLDFVVETIATSESLSAIVSALRPGATLVLKSRAAGPVPVDIAAVVRRDLTLRGVHYGSFSRAMRWLAEERVRLDDVLGPVHPLSYFVEELDGLSHREDRKLFVSAHPPEAG